MILLPSSFHYFTVFKDENTIGVDDRRQAMSDDDRRSTSTDARKRRLYVAFSLSVECRSSLKSFNRFKINVTLRSIGERMQEKQKMNSKYIFNIKCFVSCIGFPNPRFLKLFDLFFFFFSDLNVLVAYSFQYK